MRIEIKNRWTNEIIYSYECENNTILKTVQESIKNNINLRGADLSYANLRGAYLSVANLRGADFRGADLSYADFRGADFRGADFRGANLRGADLNYANLRGANLIGANLSGAKIPIYSKWSVSMIDESIIMIGCKEKKIEDWVEWFENSNEEFDTGRDSEDFKRIKAMFYAYKTYLEILNK